MAKLNTGSAPTQRGPVRTTSKRAYTEEGHLGYGRDPRSELFLLAVTNMVGEDTFYESAGDRDDRFRLLIRSVAGEPGGPEWLAGFTPFLRNEMNMRTASVVMAAETAKAMLDGAVPGSAAIVDSALQRADEPGEMVAYYRGRYGKLPQPVKRGVAKAVQRLYNERAALKWDGENAAYRMADVIELVHPKPVAEWQSALFRYLIDKRHEREVFEEPGLGGVLPMLWTNHHLKTIPVRDRRAMIEAGEIEGRLKDAGMTWESLSGWLQGPMDAKAWEAVIPSMGYMALLRNLRNFDQADISRKAVNFVVAKLADPEQVARSRQFPYRFYNAWKNVAGLRWGAALEEALDLSVQNVPTFAGRTLVLVDASGSMFSPVGGRRSQLQRWEAAALFACVLAKRCESIDLAVYDTTGTQVVVDEASKDMSVLRLMENLQAVAQRHGGGTQTLTAMRHYFNGQDRVVVLTDEQAHASYGAQAPDVRTYVFNLAGYRTAMLPSDAKTITVGGLSDAAFKMIDLVERRGHTGWPWEA